MTSFGSKIALVVGGTGNIGSATVAALLEHEEYKHVVIVSRSQDKIDKAVERIRKKVGKRADKIVGIVGNISNEISVLALKDEVVKRVGDRIDHIISSAGFSYLNHGPMIGVTFDQMVNVFQCQFFATFGAYKAFMPLVRNSSCGSYVFVTGGGPDMYLGTGTGVVTIGGSSNTALAKVAMKEHAHEAVCCTEVSFQLGVCPDPSKMGQSPFTWIACEDAGRALASVARKQKSDQKTLEIRSLSDAQNITLNGVL